jgi:coenzyme PQQ precursor peptide PqqA
MMAGRWKLTYNGRKGEMIMEWTTPAFEEVCLSCEVACYSNPEI